MYAFTETVIDYWLVLAVAYKSNYSFDTRQVNQVRINRKFLATILLRTSCGLISSLVLFSVIFLLVLMLYFNEYKTHENNITDDKIDPCFQRAMLHDK